MSSLITGLYAAFPPSLQDLAISLAGIAWRHSRYGGEFAQHLAWLRESEWWSKSQITEYHDAMLQQLVRHAYSSVPYYRKTFDRHGLDVTRFAGLQDLEKLPILTKESARQAGVALRSSGFRRASTYRTSGTTGTPLTIWKTASANRFQWAIWWRHRARFGLHLGHRFLTFGARVPSQKIEPGVRPWRVNHAIHQTYLPVSQLASASLQETSRWLRSTSFDFFAGYPSGMNVLAMFMMESGIRLEFPPRVVSTGSETLTSEVRQRLADAFGSRVTQVYGMGESAGGYAECERGNLHLDFELGIAELLPVPGCDDPGLRRLVLTGFHNPAMPFIRYDIGDHVRVGPATCACGRSSPTILSADGRTEDCVHTPDGRRVFGLNQVFKLAENVREVQVVQRRADSIEVNVVPAVSFRRENLRVLEHELRQRVGAAVEVRFALVEELPRTPNGKLRAVISEISAGHDS